MNENIIHREADEATPTPLAFRKYLQGRGILADGLDPLDGKPRIQTADLVSPIDGRIWQKAKEDDANFKLESKFYGCPIRPFEGLIIYHQVCLDKVKRFRVRWLGDSLTYRSEEPDPTSGKTGSEVIEAPRWESNAGAGSAPYLAALLPEYLGDVSVPLLIVESPIKAIALAQYGFAVIGKGGAETGLQAPSKAKDKVLALHSEANRVTWQGRTVYLIMDSGQSRNAKVARGVARDAKLLREAGADVRVCYLPERKPKGQNQADPKSYDWGPDDYIAHVLYRTYGGLWRVALTEKLLDKAAYIAVKTAKLAIWELLANAKPGDPLTRVQESTEEERDALLGDLPFVASLDFLTGVEKERVSKAFGRGKKLEIKAAEKDFKISASAKNERESEVDPLEEVLDGHSYVRDHQRRMYARIGSHMVPADSDEFIEKAAFEIREKGGGFTSKDAINTALLAIAGGGLDTVDVPIRVTRRDGKLYLDLARESGEVVEISATGCKILEASHIGFYRPNSMQALPLPVFPPEGGIGAALEPFRQLLALEADDWWSVLAWLFAALGSTGTYPILVCKGEAGAGKTTRTKLIREVIDPREPAVSRIPKDVDDVIVTAANSYAIAYDNLRHIPQDMSDMFCILATGGGAEKRTLYTTLGLTSVKLVKPLLFTGIAEVAKEPDLLDRSLSCTFRKFEGRTLTEDEIKERMEEIWPTVLGALCLACSRALARPVTEGADGIRMRGPALWGASCLQNPEAIFEAYRRSKEEATVIGTEDGIARVVIDYMAVERSFYGKAGALLEALETFFLEGKDQKAKLPRWWPGSTNKLGSELAMHVADLRAMGVTMEKEKVGRGAQRGIFYRLEAGEELEAPSDEEDEDGPSDDEEEETAAFLSVV